MDFELKVINHNYVSFYIQLWDIAKQERFGNFRRIYYKEACCAIIAIDLEQHDSLEAMPKLIEETEKYLLSVDRMAVVNIIGIYDDEKKIVISTKELFELTKRNEMHFSIVNINNIDEIKHFFDKINDAVFNRYGLLEESDNIQDRISPP